MDEHLGLVAALPRWALSTLAFQAIRARRAAAALARAQGCSHGWSRRRNPWMVRHHGFKPQRGRGKSRRLRPVQFNRSVGEVRKEVILELWRRILRPAGAFVRACIPRVPPAAPPGAIHLRPCRGFRSKRCMEDDTGRQVDHVNEALCCRARRARQYQRGVPLSLFSAFLR